LSTDIATLKISNLRKSDLGNYLVLAENKAGKDQTFCKLFIKLLPNVDETSLINPEAFKFLEAPKSNNNNENPFNNEVQRYIPPHVIIPLSDMYISEGNYATLLCKIDGFPKPKVNKLTNCLDFCFCFFFCIL